MLPCFDPASGVGCSPLVAFAADINTEEEIVSSPVSAPPEAESPPMSFSERFLGVFISPGPTFRDIARRPDFILPLLVAVPLSVAGTEIFLAKIGIEPVLRWAFEHSSRTANMSPEQMQQLLARLVPFQTIVAHILGVMWMPVLTLLVAVIGLVTLNAIFGVGTNFKTALSVPAYAYLLNVVYYLMSILMVLLGDPEYFVSNPQNPTPTHVGFFLNPLDTSKPLLALGGSLEGFSFWYMVLLGVGFSEVSGRRVKSLPIFLIFLGLWMIVVLIKMGLAALG